MVYVDDIIITRNDQLAINALKSVLNDRFKMKDLGPLRYFLGLEVVRSATNISICQRTYALELLFEIGYLGCKLATIPMDSNLMLSQEDSDLVDDPTSYRCLIGKLLYLTITRPDLSYSINRLSQYLANPRLPHLYDAMRILQYIKRTPEQGRFFSSTTTVQLKAFADSDWAACPDTQCFISGFYVFLGSYLISQKSKKQQIVSRLSAEAEYWCITNTTCELVWLFALLKDLRVTHPGSTLLFCDNRAALYIATNLVYHERNKHIKIDCFIVREKIQAGLLKTLHVHTNNQLPDIFTKAFHHSQFHTLLGKMGIHNLYSLS